MTLRQIHRAYFGRKGGAISLLGALLCGVIPAGFILERWGCDG